MITNKSMYGNNKVTRYLFADLVLDVQRGVLTRNSIEVALPKLSYELLLALLQASPTLLTQQQLMEIVWPDVVIGDETLKQRIKLLRKSLDDKASEPIYIEAVRGRGYRLVPEVNCECTLARPAAVMMDLSAHDRFPNIATGQLTGIWQRISSIGLLLVFISALFIYFIPTTPVVFDKSRIVVLPISHQKSEQPSDVAEVINGYLYRHLAQLPKKQLVSPSAVKYFVKKQSEINLQLIANKFNAGYILEGSVALDNDVVTVHLQLNDSQQQSLLWSENFTIALANMVRLDKKVADTISLVFMQLAEAEKLVSVGDISLAFDHSKTTVQVEQANQAVEYYEKGLLYYQRYRGIDNLIAIDFFKKSMAANTSYALAYAGLSQAYAQQIFQFNGDLNNKSKAIDNAYLAITYDNMSAESYKALGTAYYVAGWLSKSITPYLKSLELSPKNIETISNVGFIYSEQGKLTQALEWNKKALLINPKHVVSMVHAGQTLQRLGQYELARKWYKKAINAQPDYILATYHLGQLQLAQQHYQAAQKTYKTALKIYQDHPLLAEGLAESLYLDGNVIEAIKRYQTLVSKLNHQSGNRQNSLVSADNSLVSADNSVVENTVVENTVVENTIVENTIEENTITTISNDLFKTRYSSAYVMQQTLASVIDVKQINLLIEQIKIQLNAGSDKSMHSYHLALLYTVLSDREKNQQHSVNQQINFQNLAIRYLVQSVEQGLMAVDKLANQPTFTSLQSLPSFQKIIVNIKLKQFLANEKLAQDIVAW